MYDVGRAKLREAQQYARRHAPGAGRLVALMVRVLHLAAMTGFAALMAAAAFSDIRRLLIPNRLILGLLLLWPIHLALAPAITATEGLAAIGGAAAVFLLGALLFAGGFVGGGDVKLCAAAALWTGAARLPSLLLVTGIFGGLLSLVLLTPLGRQIAAARRPVAARAGVPPNLAGAAVPYGAAIAGAALVVALPAQGG